MCMCVSCVVCGASCARACRLVPGDAVGAVLGGLTTRPHKHHLQAFRRPAVHEVGVLGVRSFHSNKTRCSAAVTPPPIYTYTSSRRHAGLYEVCAWGGIAEGGLKPAFLAVWSCGQSLSQSARRKEQSSTHGALEQYIFSMSMAMEIRIARRLYMESSARFY